MKVAFFSTQKHEPAVFNRLNHHHQIEYFNYHLTPATVEAMPFCDAICCFVNDFINKEVIDTLLNRGVRLIALRSAGFNNVDYHYSQQKGIAVCRVPAYSPEAIAEHALALILCLNRKIHHAHNRVREGNFSLEGLMGFNLFKKTVGIIGTGKIGTALAKILHGFGCRLVASDPIENETCRKLGVNYVDLNSLLEQSDIISLHCPLNEETNYLINHDTIARMKPGVMLINTGRGKLIDTKAVIDALKTKHLGYLGIDVYEEEEPLFFENHSDDIINDDVFCRLQTFPNVLITGHQGFFTIEAVEHIAQTTLHNLTNFEQQKEPVHMVT